MELHTHRQNESDAVGVRCVTTEVCVHTTVREASNRGYHCIVVSDGCASYSDVFPTAALDMITAQDGIFGSVTTSQDVLTALVARVQVKQRLA